MTDDELIERKARRLRKVGRDGVLHTIDKNRQYGDAVRKTVDILHALFPDGIRPDQYGDLLLIVRVQDKMVRLASYNSKTHPRSADDESPWADVRGYGILGEEKDMDPAEDGMAPGVYEL